MAPLEHFEISLRKMLSRIEPKAYAKRRLRKDLVLFLDLLSLQLRVGFDLGYAWGKTIDSLEGEELSAAFLRYREGEASVATLLKRLANEYPVVENRYWFQAIRQLYEAGAPMVEAVEAFATTLRKEEIRDLEEHCRKLPTRINIYLILFFLPPTFILLFVPLIIEMQHSLNP